jgi:hypothetical protein
MMAMVEGMPMRKDILNEHSSMRYFVFPAMRRMAYRSMPIQFAELKKRDGKIGSGIFLFLVIACSHAKNAYHATPASTRRMMVLPSDHRTRHRLHSVP